MTPLLLLAVFGLTGYAAPPALARSRWLYRAPQLALVAWLTTTVTAALAAILTMATVAVPTSAAGHGLADLWHACLDGWRHYYGDASPAVVTAAAAALAATALNVVRATVGHRRMVTRFRRTQHHGLAMVGTCVDPTMVVLPHPVPAAYCVPGRPGRVVLTDSAVRVLEADQIEAVVAHERAHLAGHHARLVGLATVLEHGLGWFAPVFRRATRDVTALVEIVADEAAVRQCSGPRVAAALVALADGATPRPALAASGNFLNRRVGWLLTPPVPLGGASRLLTRLCLAAFLALPVVTVLGPTVAVLAAASCADTHHAS